MTFGYQQSAAAKAACKLVRRRRTNIFGFSLNRAIFCMYIICTWKIEYCMSAIFHQKIIVFGISLGGRMQRQQRTDLWGKNVQWRVAPPPPLPKCCCKNVCYIRNGNDRWQRIFDGFFGLQPTDKKILKVINIECFNSLVIGARGWFSAASFYLCTPFFLSTSVNVTFRLSLTASKTFYPVATGPLWSSRLINYRCRCANQSFGVFGPSERYHTSATTMNNCYLSSFRDLLYKNYFHSVFARKTELVEFRRSLCLLRYAH